MKTLDKANSLVREGRSAEALGLLTESISDPDLRPDALGHRAWLLKSMGRYEEALQDYDQLLELRPEDSEAIRQRLDTLCRVGRASEAIEQMLDHLKRNPLDRQAAELLIEFQESEGITHVPRAKSVGKGRSPSGRPLNAVIETLESDIRSFPTSVFPETGRMLYAMVRCVRPSLVIETGCYIGYSTLCMAQALEENGGGHIHTFDLFPEDEPVESPVLGRCRNRMEAARGHLERSGLASRVTLHGGDSSSGITELLTRMNQDDACVDLAFLDGDHTIEGCRKDFHAVDPFLKPGGLVLLHDTMPDRCTWVGPRHLLEELPKRSRGLYQCVNVPSPEGYGIGILQKSGGGVVGPWRPPLTDLLAESVLHRRYVDWHEKNPSST